MRSGGVAALVLAAGAGRRFGGGKLLASWRGRPLVAHVLHRVAEARAEATVTRAVVVVAPGAGRLLALTEAAEIESVVAADAAQGVSASLESGLGALGAAPADENGAALVVLGDQPLVRLDVMRVLIAEWRRGRALAVRPRYLARPDEPGHPVLLDRALWPLAAELRGDAGLGPLLRARPESVVTLDVTGSNPDVDTPDDLTTLEESSS